MEDQDSFIWVRNAQYFYDDNKNSSISWLRGQHESAIHKLRNRSKFNPVTLAEAWQLFLAVRKCLVERGYWEDGKPAREYVHKNVIHLPYKGDNHEN